MILESTIGRLLTMVATAAVRAEAGRLGDPADVQPLHGATLGVADAACRWALGGSWENPDHTTVLLAERRGGLALVVYAHSHVSLFAYGLVKLGHRTRVRVLSWAVGGGTGDPCDLAPHDLQYRTGFEALGITSVAGVVGSQVREVTVRSGPCTVRAALQNGRFVAVWPRSGVRGEVPRTPPAYDLTLDDGSVLCDVPDGTPRDR